MNALKVCPYCGQTIAQAAVICPYCGAMVSTANEQNTIHNANNCQTSSFNSVYSKGPVVNSSENETPQPNFRSFSSPSGNVPNSNGANAPYVINNYYMNGNEAPVRQKEAAPSVITRTVYVPQPAGHAKNKWLALFLCIFFGYFGAHKFYEGKIFTGILYIFTVGLFGFGWFFDSIRLLFKSNPYYVK